MPEKKIILVDMDNTVANQNQGFIDVLTRDHPEIPVVPLDQVTNFDVHLVYPEQHQELILSIRKQPEFFRNLPPIEGALEALHALHTAGHDVYLCTAPIWDWQYCIPEKYEWVEEHLGREWVGRTIMTRDKTLVAGDFLIDDKPEPKGAIAAPAWTHILFDQPYNQNFDKPRLNWTNYREILGL